MSEFEFIFLETYNTVMAEEREEEEEEGVVNEDIESV